MSEKKPTLEYLGERTFEQVADFVDRSEPKSGYSLFLDHDTESGTPEFLVWGHDYGHLADHHKDPFRDCGRCKGHGKVKHLSASLPPMPADAKPSDPIPWVTKETMITCPECRGCGMSDSMIKQLQR